MLKFSFTRGWCFVNFTDLHLIYISVISGGRPNLIQPSLFPIPPASISHRLALMGPASRSSAVPSSIQLSSEKSAFHRVVPRIRSVETPGSSSSDDAIPSTVGSQIPLSAAAAPNPPLHIGNILQEVTAQILFSTIKRLRLNQFYMRWGLDALHAKSIIRA